jgi:hypothetical protein
VEAIWRNRGSPDEDSGYLWTPACENGPLAVNSWANGPVLLCPVAVSLAEDMHVGVVVVDVDGDLVKLLDELLELLRLELSEVDRYP